MAFGEDGAIAVEELKGREDMTLHEYTSEDDRCGPVASADWSLKEPLLQWNLTKVASSEHGRHAVQSATGVVSCPMGRLVIVETGMSEQSRLHEERYREVAMFISRVCYWCDKTPVRHGVEQRPATYS